MIHLDSKTTYGFPETQLRFANKEVLKIFNFACHKHL